MTILQKQIARKVGKKEYSKYVVVIPNEAIAIAGFRSGQELNIEARKTKIILNK